MSFKSKNYVIIDETNYFQDDERNKTIFNWTRSIISIYNQLNNFPPPAQSFLERETKNNRGKRSEQQFSLESQFERFCRKKGSQPCTCFYPDHPNATHFEFDTDDTTRKALSGLNGSGPKSCEDLLNIGYKLNGYYFIRLNTQRARTVFCVFTNHSKIQISDSTLKESSEAMFVLPSKVKRLRFCGGIASIPCTFLYSDYPDATSNYHVENGPKNCEDLKDFGHSLKGFYVVRFNSKRMKVIFCDFKQTSAAEKEMQPQSAENCNAIGSKPCSCYLKNRGDIPQLELGTDDTTQKAITSNGISPENCEDLHQLGHILKGFYLVRMNRKSMKIIYCEFKIQIKNQNPAFEEREIYMTTEKTSKKQNGNVTKESMVESAKYSFSKEESQQQTQQSENDEVLFQRTSTAKIPSNNIF